MSEGSIEDKAFIRLHPHDNVMVCIKPLNQGERILVNGSEIELKKRIHVGHKLCAVTIEMGDKVIKHGVNIGSAISKISVGDHVHNHNMKSDYINSNTREENGFKGS